jgi:lysyl-tRNA synthetase class 2
LDGCGFNEFETPIIQPLYGGADAKPFMTYVNALDEKWYLQISPELYDKRLIIAGFNKVYTITKNFRNEDIDSTHNPEFTMLELYEVNSDYNDMINLTQKLVTFICWKVFRTQEFKFNGHTINFTAPWKKLTMYESLEEYAGLKIEDISDDEIKNILMGYKEPKIQRLISNYNRGIAIAKLFDLLVQPKIIQPTFITDYPKETTSLCKAHRSNPDLIERFELFVGGMELANAYTELNDPILQEKLFLEQVERKNQGDDEAHPFDSDFIEALKYGMPPTGGLGIGIDRLVMILTGADSIKEVILWPMLRRLNAKNETTDIAVEPIAEISEKNCMLVSQ